MEAHNRPNATHLKLHKPGHHLQALSTLFTLLMLVSLACSLPGIGSTPAPVTSPGQATAAQPGAANTSTPTVPALPTPTPMTLPPALVETKPLSGSQLPLTSPITLYFNQPMDHASVEGALNGQPPLSGSFTWTDDATLTFTPDKPFLPDTRLNISLGTSAQSQKGMTMLEGVDLTFATSTYLSVTQTLPAPNASEVDPSSAVVAAFNQPVVALGADPASLPAAFTIQPEAQGKGEWINTSTYIFYPDLGLAGGAAYTVSLNSELKSTDGSPLGSAFSWSFTTAAPRLVSMTPGDGDGGVRLDTGVKLTFNEAMDAASVAANFTLQDDNGSPIAGQSAWSDDLTTFTFTPTTILQRNTTFTALLGAGAAAKGGTQLGERHQASWQTVPELQVYSTDPSENGAKPNYMPVHIYLSSIVSNDSLLDHIQVSPKVADLYTYVDESQKAVWVNGTFLPDQDYTLTLAADLSDLWGSQLGQEYTLHFHLKPPDPGLSFPYNTDANFLTTQDPGVIAQVVNLSNIPMTVGTVPLSDFIAMLGPNGYDLRKGYQPLNPRSWQQTLDIQVNKSQMVNIPLSSGGGSISPGLYLMRFDLPNLLYSGSPLLVAVSNYHAVIKLSDGEVFVWAVDLRSDQPAAGTAVTIYDQDGTVLASGQTDSEGIFRSPIPPLDNPYNLVYAVLGQEGGEDFGMAISNWNDAVGPWDFGLSTDFSGKRTYAYVYSDRPIYRPGQTVYFRAVVRQAFNGRYSMPDLGSYSLTLYDQNGQEKASFDLPLSAFGTGFGEYTLPSDAQPGLYSLANYTDNTYLQIQVANYRKPEINLQVSFASDQVLSGTSLSAEVSARYFFDAPASNLKVHWALYKDSSYFYIPGGYQVGSLDTGWMNVYNYPNFGGTLGALVSQGDAQTDANGLLKLDLPTESADKRQKYTLEVTIQDESGLPVSARTSVQANPADYYIGVLPDAWSGQAGQESGFEVLTVDWNGNPSPNRTLSAQFSKVTWVRHEPPADQLGYQFPTFTPEYTLIASTDFTTDGEGKARLAFTPPDPGTYQLEVAGNGTVTQVLVWIGGPGQAVWPNLPNQRLRLTADRESYTPGDTAQVFIPNPFGQSALALLTVERDLVLRYQVIQLEPGGTSISLPLSEDDTPNVYIAVTLLGSDEQGRADFRQGYLELDVQPLQQELHVSLTSQPERSGPGEAVTFHIEVTDASGSPVQGEFSFSVVDLAALALADPNAPDILTAFYGRQPLGIRTGLSLAASAQRLRYIPGGLGGGGGEEAASVARENFPDTALWNPNVLTDQNGEASVTLTLPDSLTTWQVSARGLTADTRVGEAQTQIVATKDLLVRPTTPRFLVAGDHTLLAAVVNNNTGTDLQTEVSLQAAGFALDDTASAAQSVLVPANGRARVEWWGTAQDVTSADLLFSAQAGSYQDAVRVASGALPVVRYSAPQTFATSGVMNEGGERLELVSLPITFDVRSGGLHVELAPSLGAAIFDTLDALEYYPYECTEQTLSRFLPNLEAYTALQSFGIEAPDLKARLERTLNQGLQRLLAKQNTSGGWGWWQEDTLDPYITAYVLFGLSSARQAGVSVPEAAIQKAVEALRSVLVTPDMVKDAWMLDQLAFEHFALASAGSGDIAGANPLYAVRDQLSPWGQAVLALTLETLSPGNEQTRTLVSDLQTTAIRSATGVHWEDPHADYRNLSTTLTTSALVVYALAKLNPAAALLPDAVNYLMSNRRADGTFGSTYESAWSVLAMTEFMKGSGELGGSFAFGATLNGTPIASGETGGTTQLTPVTADIPISGLYSSDPNALTLQREAGAGRLYYTAALEVYRSPEDAAPLEQGVSIQRAYFPYGSDPKTASPIQSAQAGSSVTVRVTLVLPHDAYYLVVEDYIPSGAEILDTGLKTSQQGLGGEPGPLFNAADPFASGWGWWLFGAAQIYDDHIAWSASYLPAGTYQLTYTLVILQQGEYHVLPAHAWMFYFPEVQGTSAGEIFKVTP